MRRAAALRPVIWFLRNAAIAAGVAWVVMAYGAQVYRIQGSSMAPTLRSGERVLVNKIGVRLVSIARDDIVLFRDPTNPDTVMVKRVIGVPGDTVRFLGDTVEVLPGSDTSRPFLEVVTPVANAAAAVGPAAVEGPGAVSIALETDDYFVLGDNRSGSSDSRHWGAVARDAIIGRAVFRAYPWRRIGFVAP
jgi:signal peptidase I